MFDPYIDLICIGCLCKDGVSLLCHGFQVPMIDVYSSQLFVYKYIGCHSRQISMTVPPYVIS